MPLHGGQDKGFEELCAQLASAETPSGARFVRKGTPDAGVECYAILSDGSEWGWQAKYFDAVEDSQWSQLDKSVKTEIEKHPRIVRYFVCIPINLPDARIPGRKSAKDKWDEHVEKWTQLAEARGMAVEFIYWGSHELLERLSRPEHAGRVRFWFNLPEFDPAWFTARLDEALRTAGPRYTPEVHIDLPIASVFEAFGRTEHFFERQKAYARSIRKNLSILQYSEGTTDATVDAAIAYVSAEIEAVLTDMGAISAQPTGPLRFKAIAKQICAAEEAAEELSRLLDESEREFEKTPDALDTKMYRSYRSNPFRDRQHRLFGLMSELRTTREFLIHADHIAGSSLMLLRGAAGTGKTHLLCDVARQRVQAGRPTVLLMGQRFVSQDSPWPQTLQQLDLTGLSAEEFVGALEAAAQAAGSRALLIIDALNEGAGRTIWPSHLPAFLAQLERSPWIGVVLAIRSSYEEIIIPADVRASAVTVTHEGFLGHEYESTKAFFIHYGLELPSSPLLTPEFQNPLFLKILCQGLNALGVRRLPRGFQGITAVFDLYLKAVNERLAQSLGFDPRIPLVRRALEAVARELTDSQEHWLPLEKAQEIVNALLPGRDFERSLYRGLVVEGVLVEETTRHDGKKAEEVVFVGYERFADHLAAKTLLDRHLDGTDPASAFAQGGPLAFICDKTNCVSPGLLEALCIHIPERTRRELTTIAPTCAERWGLASAFRQSLVWRDHEAFTDDTRNELNKLCRSEDDLWATIDVLLTVATLPGHPLNAQFLDRRLRKDAMPDRDAWWSVYLHRAWGDRRAVDRLLGWVFSLDETTAIDDEVVDLCAITLAWMLTTSNRFLRDRATKALVSLLTGRVVATARLVERFADVDDPYVAERIYAVAYGVATRSHDPVAVGDLAMCVYSHVFASGSPPPHILLRDYARGVVERALHLGSAIDVVPERIRPPYRSMWPTIPTEEDIKPLLPDWSKGSHDSGELEWGRNRIGNSVMGDDFARYVIGTNSSSTSSNWLSLTLDEAPWKPPPRKDTYHEARRPPRFDLRQIQRYILKRVFDMGWTEDRFGHFDRFSIRYHGREASKAERMGKKYQWIAYHEIMAFISDHFQYRKQFREEEGDQAYEGPWQNHLRDIDPSCTLRSVRGGTSWDSHTPAWWGSARYDAWGDLSSPRDWVRKCDDLPRIEELLIVTNPADGSRWLNVQGYFNWQQRPPDDRDSTEVERREIWYICTGCLVRSDDAQSFLKWAEGVDFGGRWMPEAAQVNQMFLGEHAWAPASRYFQKLYYGDDGWTQPSHGCPVRVRTVALEYLREASGFDCSVDESFTLHLPVSDLVTGLGIRWSGRGADFVDAADRVAAQDPTVHADGPSALLLREDLVKEFLAREKLTICWTVLGEKRVLSPGFGTGPYHPALIMTGAYVLSEGRAIGFVKRMLDDQNSEQRQGRSGGLDVINIARTAV
jgi:hypothetical protein